LQSELEKFRSEAQNKASELKAAQDKLNGLLKDPPPDGRLEAAWAAMTYISSKAGDTMGQLQSKLDKQARDLETSFLELNKRDQEIKHLKERQDNLSLLYWTMLSLASEGQGISDKDEPEIENFEGGYADAGDWRKPKEPVNQGLAGQGSVNSVNSENNDDDDIEAGLVSTTFEDRDISEFKEGFLDTADDSEASSASQANLTASSETADGSNKFEDQSQSKSSGLGGSLLSELRKAARRSLFSLFLTGGLVLFLSDQSLANATIDLGGPETPMILSETTIVPASRAPSRYIGRTLDLGFLAAGDRNLGTEHYDEQAKKLVASQADRWGQTPQVWLRLIRLTYDREETVFLTDLDSEKAPVVLLQPHMPTIALALSRSSQFEEFSRVLLQALDSFNGPEGGYWDRLYQAVRKKLGNERDALAALIGHIQRRPSRGVLIKPEYAGLLRPFPDFESMPAQNAVEFLTNHIKDNWGKGRQKRIFPKGKVPAVLAYDIIYTALIHKVPRTLAAAMLHDDFTHFGHWPDTLSLYAWGTDLSKLIIANCLFLEFGEQPLCDLDNLVNTLRCERQNPCGVNQSHLALLGSLSKALSPDVSIFNVKSHRS
jgi:hypothetical protein